MSDPVREIAKRALARTPASVYPGWAPIMLAEIEAAIREALAEEHKAVREIVEAQALRNTPPTGAASHPGDLAVWVAGSETLKAEVLAALDAREREQGGERE